MGLFSKTILPLYQSLNRKLFGVSWKDLRQTKPISEIFGKDRGKPVDRYFIEHFLAANCKLIKGTVVEIADNYYSNKYAKKPIKSEILHFTEGNPMATIVADLSKPETLPTNIADCFICTQTLNFLYDFKEAIKGIHQILNKNGTALITLGGISQISRYDMDRWGDYWRFTTKSAKKIFGEVFGEGNVSVDSYGNVLTSIAFLHGLSSEELKEEELMHKDKNYQQLISVVATKK